MPKLKNNVPLTFSIILFSLAFIVAVVSLVLYFQKKASLKSLQPLPESTQLPGQVLIPTKTPQEIEIISKIKTYTVNIENDQFNPSQLQIKVHDQIVWVNKNNKTHKITGEGWGNVLIENGENFTRTFDEPGTYSYSCALHPEMKGTITVSQ
ncbi:MAG: plastocyanin/azurin family copper-binding protein [Candidatus Margulisiibacteriota bacterium]